MMNKNIYLIVGLGNFESKYNLTRHNVGFMAIDSIANFFKITETKTNCLNGIVYKYHFGNDIFYFAKPLTYMNLSGNFVRDFMNFYKIPINNILVICDDLNLEIGRMRFRLSGSSGGQNGLKNIIECINNDSFKRLRVGISKPKNNQIANYVLSNFSSSELSIIEKVLNKVNNFVSDFINKKDSNYLMNKYN